MIWPPICFGRLGNGYFRQKDVFVLFSPLKNKGKQNFSNAPFWLDGWFWVWQERPARTKAFNAVFCSTGKRFNMHVVLFHQLTVCRAGQSYLNTLISIYWFLEAHGLIRNQHQFFGFSWCKFGPDLQQSALVFLSTFPHPFHFWSPSLAKRTVFLIYFIYFDIYFILFSHSCKHFI